MAARYAIDFGLVSTNKAGAESRAMVAAS